MYHSVYMKLTRMLLKGSTAVHKIQKSTPQDNDAITPPYFEEKHRSDSFDYSLTTPPISITVIMSSAKYAI